MTGKVSDAAVTAWARLLRAHATALGRVEGALKRAGLPQLAWYDVLLETERAPAGLRPKELEARMLLAQYNLSRLLDRMAAAGVVERRSCDDDRRGLLVAMTEEGRKLRRRMWPVYARAIEAAVGARLSGAEAATLAALLGQLYGADERAAPAATKPEGAGRRGE